jgi:hypothetical protein
MELSVTNNHSNWCRRRRHSPTQPGNNSPYNPRDLSIMRVDQSFAGGAVKQILSEITVRKPKADEWVRVHPEYRVNTWIYRPSSKPNELYYVCPHIQPLMQKHCRLTSLYVTLNSQGVLFVWPVSVDNPDKTNNYLTSAHTGAEQAIAAWTQLIANQAAGRYDIFLPEGMIPAPEWPDFSFQQIIDAAFIRQTVDSEDHAVLKHIRGRL